MERYSVRITRQAREHLLEIRRYIEKELLSPAAAKSTLAAIKSELQTLSSMPNRIHLTPEEPWRSLGVRRMRVRNYYIYLWIDEENKKVQIIGVIYVRRDQEKRLKQMDME